MLLAFIATPFLSGLIGSALTKPHIEGWYASANLAPWTPPNGVFVAVWFFLYILIGVSGWLMWRYRPTTSRETEIRFRALWFFGFQLVLNAIWSPLFFNLYPMIGATALWLALIIMVLLWLLLMSYIVEVSKIDKLAAYVMIPYVFWATYAGTINLYMAIAN